MEIVVNGSQFRGHVCCYPGFDVAQSVQVALRSTGQPRATIFITSTIARPQLVTEYIDGHKDYVISVEPMPQLGPSSTDTEIMAETRQRNPEAMQFLYDRYFRRAFALAVRMLGDAAAAEDCVHDAFLKVWQRPEMYDDRRGNFASWFLTTVHNRASNVLRTRQHHADPLPQASDDPDKQDGPDLIDEQTDVEHEVWVREQQRVVRQALTLLNDAQRQVLELAYFSGMTQAEIAVHLDQPLGTVKTRIRTAMHKLRAALEEQHWQLH